MILSFIFLFKFKINQRFVYFIENFLIKNGTNDTKILQNIKLTYRITSKHFLRYAIF